MRFVSIEHELVSEVAMRQVCAVVMDARTASQKVNNPLRAPPQAFVAKLKQIAPIDGEEERTAKCASHRRVDGSVRRRV